MHLSIKFCVSTFFLHLMNWTLDKTRPCGKGKYQSRDNTKIRIKWMTLTKRVKRTMDKRHT